METWHTTKLGKFIRLTEIYGIHDPSFWFLQNFADGTAQGICTNLTCEFTIDRLPAFSKTGLCKKCNTRTVTSGFVLFGITDPYDTPYHRKQTKAWRKNGFGRK